MDVAGTAVLSCERWRPVPCVGLCCWPAGNLSKPFQSRLWQIPHLQKGTIVLTFLVDKVCNVGRGGLFPIFLFQKSGPVIRGVRWEWGCPFPSEVSVVHGCSAKSRGYSITPPRACRCQASWGAAVTPICAGLQPFLQTQLSIWTPYISCLCYVWRVLLRSG